MKRIALAGVLLLGGAVAYVALKPSRAPDWSVARRDSDLLARGWTVAPYRSPLQSQTNPSACGPTSLANVWSSLDAGTFESPCPAGFCFGGLTLDELAKAAERPGWTVTVLRDLTIDQLREELSHVADPNRRYVINFHRGPIFGTGGGHHSPIGGLVGDDGVFILDVNASYGPWVVPVAKLFEAMDTVDGSSGKKRGLLRIEVK